MGIEQKVAVITGASGGIGAALVKTGDFKTAIVHLEIATGRLPAFAPAHISLAEAYEHIGRTEDAKRERRTPRTP